MSQASPPPVAFSFPHALLPSFGRSELNLPSLVTGDCQKHHLSSHHQGKRGREAKTEDGLPAPSSCPQPWPAPTDRLPSPAPVCSSFLTPSATHPRNVIPTQLPTPGTKPRMGENSTRKKAGLHPEERAPIRRQGAWASSFLVLTSCVISGSPVASLSLFFLSGRVGAGSPRPPEQE